jgi:hypothetical protein
LIVGGRGDVGGGALGAGDADDVAVGGGGGGGGALGTGVADDVAVGGGGGGFAGSSATQLTTLLVSV